MKVEILDEGIALVCENVPERMFVRHVLKLENGGVGLVVAGDNGLVIGPRPTNDDMVRAVENERDLLELLQGIYALVKPNPMMSLPPDRTLKIILERIEKTKADITTRDPLKK